MIGFSSLDDVQRIVNAVQFTEQFRPPSRRYRRSSNRTQQIEIVLGKTDASHAKGVTGTVSVWAGLNLASLADTGTNITAVNLLGSIASGKYVVCVGTALGYLIIAAEC